MKAVLFAFLILTVAVHFSTTQSRGLQPSHQVDNGPPTPSVADFEENRQSTYTYFLKQYRPVIFVVFLICGGQFAIDLALLLKRHKAGLLPSSYYTMISRPTKDAAQPDDRKGAKKKQRRTKIRATGKFDEGECSICYASPQVDKSFPPCGHTYCFDCLVRCCNIQKKCPTCQRGISSFRHRDGKMRCEWNQLKWKLVLITLVVQVSFDIIMGLIDTTVVMITFLLSYIIGGWLGGWLVQKLIYLGLLTNDLFN